MGDKADVRIGSTWYSLAEGLDDPQLGFSFRRFPISERWESIFAPRETAAGEPGVQNVRADDLRWVQSDWSGGEGQLVLPPGDADAARRYKSSEGIDTSREGEIRLGRAVFQQGSTGAAAVTVEGNSFSDAVGSSTVVNTTDRRLNAHNDIVIHTTGSLTAAVYQAEFWAYLEALTAHDGDTMVEDLPNVTTNNDRAQLKSKGARARTANRSPCPNGEGSIPTEVTFNMAVTNDRVVAMKVQMRFSILNQTSGDVIEGETKEFDIAPAGTEGFDQVTTFSHAITFKAKEDKNYRYRVQIQESTVTAHGVTSNPFPKKVEVVSWTEDPIDTREVLWEIRQGTTVVEDGTVELTSGSTTRIVSKAFLGTVAAYNFRVKWKTGETRKPVLDKLTYELLGMDDAFICELGANDHIWLSDYNAAGTPTLFTWDPVTQSWDSVAAVGASGDQMLAMAHSDNYEFVSSSDKKIYRFKQPATGQAYTAAFTDSIAGIAVGGGRLWALTESVANGPQLYEMDLEGTPTVTTTVRTTGMALPKGTNYDPQANRIAGTGDGCVFFVNDGPDCKVYRWNTAEQEGTNLVDGGMPRGFRGQAIVHGLGFTWLGGGFVARPETGSAATWKPAIMVIDPNGQTSQVQVALYREGETGRVDSMQLYGSDLWVLVEHFDTTNEMRLWRVDLEAGAAHLHQRILPGLVDGVAAGLAVNHSEKIMVWTHGAPYLERTAIYTTLGEVVSSDYDFGMLEPKVLQEVDVVCECPAGTSVEVWYSVDGEAEVLAGTLTASGPVTVSSPTDIVTFHYANIKLRLKTDDVDVTPRVFSWDVRAFTTEFRRVWEVLLWVGDESANYHVDGQQLPGAVASRNLFATAAAGGLTEFEDRYTDEDDPQTYTVQITDPERIATNRDEGYLRVVLVER